jgi:nucleoside-triphosphatase THEP1
MTSTATTRRRFPWLLALIAAGCVGLQFPGRLDLSTLALAIWLGTLAIAVRPLLRRLWYPKFYAFSGVLVLLSGLVLGTTDLRLGPIPLSSSGLNAGALMLVRGTLIFGLTAWAASLYTRGEMQAAVTAERAGWRLAIAVALKLVPELAVQLGTAWRNRKRDGRRLAAFEAAAVELLRAAADTADGLTRNEATPAAERAPSPLRRVAISGPSGSGKTTALRALGQLLAPHGLSAGGVLQPCDRDGNDRRGYWLEDVASGERRDFARRRIAASHGFDFEDAGWNWAAERIRAARRERTLVIVDELGKVEARGGGHLLPLLETIDGSERLWLCGVRQDALVAIEQRLGRFDLVLAPTLDAAEQVAQAQRIAALLIDDPGREYNSRPQPATDAVGGRP